MALSPTDRPAGPQFVSVLLHNTRCAAVTRMRDEVLRCLITPLPQPSPRASPGRATYSHTPWSEQDTLTAATRGERARAACEITTTRLGPRHEHAAGIRLSRKRESATASSSCVRQDIPSFSLLCFVLPNTRTRGHVHRGRNGGA